MRFLFRLDLSLHEGAGIFFLEFWNMQLNKGYFAFNNSQTMSPLLEPSYL